MLFAFPSESAFAFSGIPISGLLPDFYQRIVHRVGLFFGVVGIEEQTAESGNFEPRFWFQENILRFAKEGFFLVCGIACVLLGLVLIRVGVPGQGSIAGSVGLGVSGLGMWIAAQWLLGRFLDLVS